MTSQVSRNEAPTEQLDHNPKYTHPTIPNLRKSKGTKNKAKKEAMLPETMEEGKKVRKREEKSPKKYLQERRKVNERKCERGPVSAVPSHAHQVAEKKETDVQSLLYVSS